MPRLRDWNRKVTRRIAETTTGPAPTAPSATPSSPAPSSNPTSATAVTAPAASVDWTSLLNSSISVPPASPPSPSDTASAMTVLAYLDLAPVSAFDWPSVLDPVTHERLARIAEGRNEPLDAVVWAIAEYFAEAEDERAEMPLADALTFYCENQLV